MTVCHKNLQHAQNLQKQPNNNSTKSRSYFSDDKVWLNNKYIKIKQNQKHKIKYFKLF